MFALQLSWAEDKDGIAPIAEVVEGILTRILAKLLHNII